MTHHPRILLLLPLAVLAACGDARGPVDPAAAPLDGGTVLTTLRCDAQVATGAVRCREQAPAGGGSRVILGGPNGSLLQITSSNDATVADTFAFDVTVLHRIVQPLGTTNGTTAHVDGVRVFFSADPVVTSRVDDNLPGSISVANADGTAIFTSAPADYFQYAGLLVHNTTSAAKRWKLQFSNVATFSFAVMVSGQVKYPQGWTTLSQASLGLTVNGDDEVRAIPRNVLGQVISDTMTWTISNPSVASITPVASQYVQVVGVSPGTAWLRAVSTRAPTVQRDSILVTVY